MIEMTEGNIRKFLLAALAAAAFALSANAEVLTLTNGDKITGKVKSANDQQVIFESQFGDLTVPRTSITAISKDENSAEVPQKAAALASSSSKAAAVEEEADPYAPTARKRTPQWVDDYRNFIRTNLPENWQFRLRGGLEYRQTTSSSFAVYSAFDIKREWEHDTFAATAYYNYTTETSVAGVTSTTLDKYGADTAFRHDFVKGSSWYVQNLLGYRRDMVKGISDQVDEAVTFGYRFDLKRYDLIIDIGPGPAVRYINAANYDTKWVFMPVLQEDISWNFSSVFTFEQSGYVGFNIQRPEEYSAYLRLGLVAHITEVVDLALRYSYDFDSINSPTAQKSEQRLMLSFEVPFNWKR